MSGSPIPRLTTSTPAARLARTLRSSSANRYGGIRSRRLLRRMQLLDEGFGECAAEHRHRPPRQFDVQLVGDLDAEHTAVKDDRDRRRGARGPVHHVSDSRAGGAGSARRGPPPPALEDPAPDRPGLELGEPRHVGPVREQLVMLDLGPKPVEVQAQQLVYGPNANRTLRVAALDVLKAPAAPAG